MMTVTTATTVVFGATSVILNDGIARNHTQHKSNDWFFLSVCSVRTAWSFVITICRFPHVIWGKVLLSLIISTILEERLRQGECECVCFDDNQHHSPWHFIPLVFIDCISNNKQHRWANVKVKLMKCNRIPFPPPHNPDEHFLSAREKKLRVSSAFFSLFFCRWRRCLLSMGK